MSNFELFSEFELTGDQPSAFRSIVKNFEDGKKKQVLLGVTGSGKTFTMANVIQELKKQGYTSSQIYYAMNQVNLGGGNVRVRQPLGFNAQQQNSPSKQPYSYAQQQQVPANKNHKKLFLIIIFVIIISIFYHENIWQS